MSFFKLLRKGESDLINFQKLLLEFKRHFPLGQSEKFFGDNIRIQEMRSIWMNLKNTVRTMLG